MAENSLLEKIDGLQHKFEEISTLITDPDVIADMKRFVRLNKEYRELEKITGACRKYKKMLADLNEAKQLLSDSDADVREMAKAEIDDIEPKLPAMEEEIKILMIPPDPEDAKNAIVEIRGGTGGDEAALFAGDLFKMYVKYCENKGWTVQVSS